MEHVYIRTLRERFGGVLSAGSHIPSNDLACAIECESIARGREKSGDPVTLPDIRPLNDAYPNDASRTAAMSRLVIALWDWPEWSGARCARYLATVTKETIRRIIPIALRARGLDAEAERCEREGTADAAIAAGKALLASGVASRAAAYVATCDTAYDNDGDSNYLTYLAARAATLAACAATIAACARLRVLDAAIDIWVEAAQRVATP
jgi:hypothetical protein